MRLVASTIVFLTLCYHNVLVVSKDKFAYTADEHGGIPVFDIGSWTQSNESMSSAADRTEIAFAVGNACADIGFFAVTGHAVNAMAIENAWKTSADFFDLALETKMASKTDDEKEYPYGYENSERLQLGKLLGNAVDNSSPDLKETYSFGPSNPASGMPPRRYPANRPEFQEAMEVYYREMEMLSRTLLKIFSVALDLPEDWFENKVGHHLSALRILNYFPVDASTVKPGAIRASAHSDYGVLTILRSGGPGLQVKKDGAETDVWIDVPTLPDSFIINIGDMMQRLTNGAFIKINSKRDLNSRRRIDFRTTHCLVRIRIDVDKWVSTLHRVVLHANDTEGIVERRQSIAYFCNVDGDTIIEPIETCRTGDTTGKYAPVTAKEYLMTKHLASMAVDAETNGDEL